MQCDNFSTIALHMQYVRNLLQYTFTLLFITDTGSSIF